MQDRIYKAYSGIFFGTSARIRSNNVYAEDSEQASGFARELSDSGEGVSLRCSLVRRFVNLTCPYPCHVVGIDQSSSGSYLRTQGAVSAGVLTKKPTVFPRTDRTK